MVRPLGDVPPGSAEVSPEEFARILRGMAWDRWRDICANLTEMAAEGQRWALELVLKFTVGDPPSGQHDADARLRDYVEEIREAMHARE